MNYLNYFCPRKYRSEFIQGAESPLFFYPEYFQKIIMALKEDIIHWINGKTEEGGIFTVEIDISSHKVISVYLDSIKGITVSDCALISRHISNDFGDKLNGYSLVVSSAGLDRPLTHHLQFMKNTGRNVTVEMKDGKIITGKMDSASNAEIILTTFPNSKKEIPQSISIMRDQIKEVKLVISFK